MQGVKKTILSSEYILSLISEWQIFSMYIPNLQIGKRVKSVFRKDKHPSMMVFVKEGHLYFKDWGDTRFRGDCFRLVELLFSLSFIEAMKKVADDFGITGNTRNDKRMVYESPVLIEKPVLIQAVAGKWEQWHKDYLSSYTLSPRDMQCLPDTRVFPVAEWAMNRKRIYVRKKEIVLGYSLTNEQGNWLKIYRPERKKEEKWRSNIPYTQMHGLDNMKGCSVGILTKSVKDAAVLIKYITPAVCVIQGENIEAVSPENVEFLKNNCRQLYVAMDCDETGKKASYEITKELGALHVNPPDKLMEEGETDFSGMVKAWGVEVLKEHFQNKKIII